MSHDVTFVISVGGLSLQAKVSRDGVSHVGGQTIKDDSQKKVPALSAGQSGSVTAKDVGADGTGSGEYTIITFSADHGLSDGGLVGLFWDDGKRIGLTIAAHTDKTITVSGGHGDDIPAAATDVVASVPFEFDSIAFNGNKLQLLVVTCDQRGAMDFLASDGTAILNGGIEVAAAKEAFIWSNGSVYSTPLAAVVASVKCYNGSTTVATMSIAGAIGS